MSQAEHPDPANPTALIPLTRAAYYGSTPAWPTGMIAPTGSEWSRWSQLWSYRQAAVWFEAGQESIVATLVRLEQRCGRRRSSVPAAKELERIRCELGLDIEQSH